MSILAFQKAPFFYKVTSVHVNDGIYFMFIEIGLSIICTHLAACTFNIKDVIEGEGQTSRHLAIWHPTKNLL